MNEKQPFRIFKAVLRSERGFKGDDDLRLAGREEVKKALAGLDGLSPEPGMFEKVMARLEVEACEASGTAKKPMPRRTGPRRSPAVMAAAGAAALALTVGLAFIWLIRAPAPRPAEKTSRPASESASRGTSVVYVKVAGRPADVFVYRPRDSDLTIIWVQKRT